MRGSVEAVETYSPRELCAAAGVSSQVLDYWARTALVVPEPEGGYSSRSVSLAVVLGRASALGAAGPALARIAARLSGPTTGWPDDLWLSERGEVSVSDDAAAAIVLHVRRVLASAGTLLMHALSAA